jgi:hypothetical protein
MYPISERKEFAISTRILAAIVTVLLFWPASVFAVDPAQTRFLRALDRMMVELGPESARASRAIKEAYRAHLDLLVLDRYAEMEGALSTGGLAPLPSDPVRFNVAPRLTGASPIGEKDLDRQTSYIAARPATIGALLDVASRVKSGPVEVTSLVRHSEYQDALRASNANATTSVPMHTMGLAFDIALVNSTLETAHEIRDVLRRMQREGSILFIGERRQLVFHVVPHPSKLGAYTTLYTQALNTPVSAGTPVVAFSPVRGPGGVTTPHVTAEVIAVLPSGAIAAEWWAAEDAHANIDLAVEVAARPAATEPHLAEDPPIGANELAAAFAGLLTLLVAITWSLNRRPRHRGPLLGV